VSARARRALLALALLAPAPAAAQGDQADNVWDARVRASAEAAQAYQGPLDGAWILTDEAGKPMFDFQLVERAGGREGLEGVFRDLRRPAVPGDIGLVDSLARTGGLLTLTFRPQPDAPPATLSLKAGADGAWTGDLREGGAVIAVRLRRGQDF
jgi:hypothetical protein